MGGMDKGLMPWRGQPLAWHVASRLEPQVCRLNVNANRHQSQYSAWPWTVSPDDADLPQSFGPLAGMLTGLRQVQADWLLVVPCDTPLIPADLATRLLMQAQEVCADIAVPLTQTEGEAPRHHWTCALIRQHCLSSLEAAVGRGNARVRDWVTHQRWTGVSFGSATAFQNFNHPGDLA